LADDLYVRDDIVDDVQLRQGEQQQWWRREEEEETATAVGRVKQRRGIYNGHHLNLDFNIQLIIVLWSCLRWNW